jgi:hypothetical protein
MLGRDGLGCLAAIGAFVIGVVMLFPGLCALVLTPEAFSTNANWGGLILWAVGIILGGYGVVLITMAVRGKFRD